MRNTCIRLTIILIFISFSHFSWATASIDQQIEQLMEMAVAGKDSDFIHLVDNEKLINKADSKGHTPLFAALFGSPALVAGMLERGSNVRQTDNNDMTPLISASILGYHQAVKLLLEHGANIKHMMKDGNAALKVAVVSASANALPTSNKHHHQFDATVQELVNNGADVNALDQYGAPILLYPIFNKSYAICETLLKAKADPNYIYKGSSLLAIARQFSGPKIADLLVQYGAK